jgi:hypothetical protein
MKESIQLLPFLNFFDGLRLTEAFLSFPGLLSPSEGLDVCCTSAASKIILSFSSLLVACFFTTTSLNPRVQLALIAFRHFL